ncbi:MAG: hypothetical protein WC686_03710 [Candidatus Shapirobacteria bacterium]
MPKKIKYIISSVLAAVGFYFFISLPYEVRYFGLMVGTVLTMFCFWFGLGIIFDKSLYIRLMSVILPSCFFVGFGMFIALLPLSVLGMVSASVFFGVIFYILFLVENVFLVAIGYKTVPLYRAAYTVSLMVLLLAAFFMFDTLLSFNFPYWGNMLVVFVLSFLIFFYQFWAMTIELPDDGVGKDKSVYVFIPAWLLSQIALVFSFWPVGIFKGSIYLVSGVYVLSGLIQAEIRERLFKRTWIMYIWIGVAILIGIISVTRW